VCLGDNICGYPCECQPLRWGNCMSDLECQVDCAPGMDCGARMRCDLSQCLPAPGCDPTSGMACPAVCYGICVADTQYGCRSDYECPTGQRCETSCMGWGCAPAAGSGEVCACPPDDPNCYCNADGSCQSQSCEGWCVPDYNYLCDVPPPDGTCRPIDCAEPGTAPVQVGMDATTCCPIMECLPQTCVPKGIPCVMPACAGAVPLGTDANCCPIFCCPGDASCPVPLPATRG
jgi:hypothetical protein